MPHGKAAHTPAATTAASMPYHFSVPINSAVVPRHPPALPSGACCGRHLGHLPDRPSPLPKAHMLQLLVLLQSEGAAAPRPQPAHTQSCCHPTVKAPLPPGCNTTPHRGTTYNHFQLYR